MTTRSTPERLDEAVETLLAGERPAVDAELRPLARVADLLADALRPMPPGDRFEAQLARRLAAERGRRRLSHGRLLVAGALSSAALGVTVTAWAVWRSTRRTPAVSHRLIGR